MDLMDIERMKSELATRARELASARARIAETLTAALRSLATLAEERNQGTRTRRIADFSVRAAAQLGLAPSEVDRIKRAALLHHVGRSGFADTLLLGPQEGWGPSELHVWKAYPAKSESIMRNFPELANEAAIVRSHCERFDGSGFPDGIGGELIPVGSRVLAAAIAFDGALGSSELSDRSEIERAARETLALCGSKLDPTVTFALLRSLGLDPSALTPMAAQGLVSKVPEPPRELQMRRSGLVPGMTLTRDVLSPSGNLLLPAGQMLEPAIIALLDRFEERQNVKLTFFVSSVIEERAEH